MIKREVIQKAIREYVGRVEYKYGSRNPDSGQVDCGGFVYSLLKQSGIDIKDSNCKGLVKQLLDSKEYIKIGIDEFQEGDIICFKSSLNPDLGNMGVVIDKNTFIYATNNNGVTIEFLDSGYVEKNFVFGIGRKRKDIGEALYIISNTNNRIAKQFNMKDLERIYQADALKESKGCIGVGVITDNTIKSDDDYIVICENGVQSFTNGVLSDGIYYTDIIKQANGGV